MTDNLFLEVKQLTAGKSFRELVYIATAAINEVSANRPRRNAVGEKFHDYLNVRIKMLTDGIHDLNGAVDYVEHVTAKQDAERVAFIAKMKEGQQ